MKAIEFLKEYENPESAKQEIFKPSGVFNPLTEFKAFIKNKIWK